LAPVETVLSYGCVIWTDPRTAGSSFLNALGDVSGLPTFYEPFQYGPNPREWAQIYEDWCIDGDPAPLYQTFSQRALIKHIPEAFDDNFNADLARAAEYNGYRHIRLIRCDTFARLASRGIAEQIDVWVADKATLDDLQTGDLAPLDVPHLISDLRLDMARWDAVQPHLTSVLTVRTEDVVSPMRKRRHACLRRILRFLELPPEGLGIIDEALARGGQNTSRIWRLLPNLSELRTALILEGVV
jgi:hypothetical protein